MRIFFRPLWRLFGMHILIVAGLALAVIIFLVVSLFRLKG